MLDLNTRSPLTESIVASAPIGGFAAEFVAPAAVVPLGLYKGGIAKLDTSALQREHIAGAQPFGTPFASVDGSINEIAFSMSVRGLHTVFPVHQVRQLHRENSMLDAEHLRATQLSQQLRIGKEFDVKEIALNATKFSEASHTATPTTKWDNGSATAAGIIANVRTALDAVEDSSGAVCNKILFGRKAWRLFSQKVSLNSDSDADLRIEDAHLVFSGVDECQVASKTYENEGSRTLVWDDDFVLCFADDTSEAMQGAEGQQEERLADGETWGFMHTIRPGVLEGGVWGEVFTDEGVNPPGSEMTVVLLYDVASWVDYNYAYLLTGVYT